MGNYISLLPGSMEAEDFTNHGVSIMKRFGHTSSLEDIEEAVVNFEKALECTQIGDMRKATRLSNLAIALNSRFERLGGLDDIHRSIAILEEAVSITQESQPEFPHLLSNLGNAYGCRYKRTGVLEDLDKSIFNHRQAVNLTDAPLATWLTNLGTSYLYRFMRTGVLNDVNQAISCHQRSIQSTPESSDDLAGFYNNLGYTYFCRYEHTGDLDDLDASILNHEKSIALTPVGHADLSTWFGNLGNSYSRRGARSGQIVDINRAIDSHQKAADLTPRGHAQLPVVLNNLGCSYSFRFEYKGDLQDIDSAISHHQNALISTPADHADLPRRFTNLGISYAHRFQRTKNLQDIDYAVLYHKKAVDCTSPGHIDLPRWACNLGCSYLGRFDLTGDVRDLDLAIVNHQHSINHTEDGHADLSRRLSNAGNAHERRFELNGDAQDARQAILYHQNALRQTPIGHSHLPSRLANLAVCYMSLFQQAGTMNHLNNAISHYQAAIKHASIGHAELPSLLFSLGNAYLSKFRRSEEVFDIQSCIGAYRRGAASNGFPSIRLSCAKEAAILADSHDHSHCLDDFSVAISLLSEVAGLEQTIHRRHNYIHPHSTFISTAVSTALSFGKVDLALEWLEQGRCLVWNQITDLRNPIDRLKDRSPSHAIQFTNIALQLESYGTRAELSTPASYENLSDDLHAQEQTLAHTRLASAYKIILDEIRSLPDFQDFLRPRKCKSILSSLPREGPVIIFNVHSTRCDALALSTGMEHPLHIPLQSFSASDAEYLRKILQTDILDQRGNDDQTERASRRRKDNPNPMSFILRELWHKVVIPILDALAYPRELTVGVKRSRLWWCPTGPLSFLPLHAAGIYGEKYRHGLCVSDFVVSSYTPTVRSVVEKSAASESSSSKSHNLLLVGQANTPGLSSLPSTRTEIISVQSITKTIPTLLLDDADATVEGVQKEMMSHSWAHFACHGVQDRANPLKSGLFLQNGRLTLLEIMKQRITDPKLAFLSACQTSQGDSVLSDEVVHLAAGMLAVGYRGVIGTMWNITDSYGPRFSTEFYRYLLRESNKGGLDSTQAAFALDYATKTVRDNLKDTERALMTWVPYVHLGY